MHYVARNPVFYELIEKRSRFLTYCERVKSTEEFKSFLNRLKSQYPDARHFCYGFRIGELNQAERGFSDDGEPSGTAGMPILNVIDHSQFSDIAVIVVRYFGGTKLGTGGLARAYSEASKKTLDLVEWDIYEKQQRVELRCDFHQEHQLRYIIDKQKGRIINTRYLESVEIEIEVAENADLSTLALYRINRSDSV